MANFADWSTLTYVNGTTPALNATNLNKNENALEDVMDELNYSHGWSLKPVMQYGFMTGQKLISNFEDDSDWTLAGTSTKSAVYNTPNGRGVKINEDDNTGSNHFLTQTLSSTLDLTKMNNGRTSATTDYISLRIYNSDDTYVTDVWVYLGDDSSNYFYYHITPSTGWDAWGMQKASFSTNGSPSGWDSIDWVQIVMVTDNNAEDEYIVLDYLGLVQRDASRGVYQPWWYDNGSGNYSVEQYFQATIDTIIHHDYWSNKLAFNVVWLSGQNFAEVLCTVNSFSIKTECYSRATGYGCCLMWFISGTEYIQIDIRSSSLVIYEYDSGGTDQVTVALDSTIAYNDRMVLQVDKVGDVIRAQLEVDGQTPVFASWETSFDADESGCVGFLKSADAQEYAITDFSVGHNHNAMPPFMADGLTLTVVKRLAEAVTSSTTVQADDELGLNLPSNSTFEIFANIIAQSDSTTPDLRHDWSTTGDVSYMSYRSILCPATSTTDTSDTNVRIDYYTEATDSVCGLDGSSNEAVLQERFIIKTGVSGASLYFRWAQYTSDANAVNVEAGSFIIARKIG